MIEAVASGLRAVCTAAVAVAWLGAAPETAAASFTPIVVPGAMSTFVAGVSADGSVVAGTSIDASGNSGFRWTAATGPVGIGFLGRSFLPGILDAQGNRVAGISADGSVIAGTFEQPVTRDGCAQPDGLAFRPFRWTAATGLVDVRNAPTSPTCYFVNAISGDGNALALDALNFDELAVRWTTAGGFEGLGWLNNATPPTSEALAISFDGSVVVGQSNYPNNFGLGRQATRWDDGLLALGGLSDPINSAATAVSPDGSAVFGWTRSSASPNEAFLWTAATGMIGLGAPGGGPAGFTTDNSIIVSGGIVWDAVNGARDLRTVLAGDYGLASHLLGWELISAVGISADGLAIVGNGVDPEGRRSGWIAVIPEPSTLPLLGLAVAGVVWLRRRITPAGTCLAVAAFGVVVASQANASCDCPSPPCAGTSLAVASPDRNADLTTNEDPMDADACDGCTAVGTSSWTLNFTCNGGACTCGRYINGDYWIVDPNCDSETTANSVVFTSEVPSDRDCAGQACNGLMKDPVSNGNGFDARIGFGPSYNAALNITLDPTDYEANVADGTSNRAASFVKAISIAPACDGCGYASFSINPACGTCATNPPVCTQTGNCNGSNGQCIHSYYVVTLVCEAPPADAWRPPYAYSPKPPASVGATPVWREANVNYDVIPEFAMLGEAGQPLQAATTYQEAYDRLRMPQIDHWRANSFSQSLVALVNSGGPVACSTSGAAMGIARSESLLVMLDDDVFTSGSPSRRDIARAWIQAGIDYYGILNGAWDTDPNVATSVRWQPSGGQASNRKAPLAVAAMLLDRNGKLGDDGLRDRVRDAVTDAYPVIGLEDAWFEEDGNAYASATAIGGPRALLGSYCNQSFAEDVNLASTCADWWYDDDPDQRVTSRTCRDPDGYIDGGAWWNELPTGYTYSVLSSNGFALAQTLWPQLREISGHDPYWMLLDRLEGEETIGSDVDSAPGGIWANDNCSNTEPACTPGNVTCTTGGGRICDNGAAADADPVSCAGSHDCTCQSWHGKGGRGAWSGYVSTAVESAYQQLRGCAASPQRTTDCAAGSNCCTGYNGLYAGDSVCDKTWCVGPECCDTDADGVQDSVDICRTIANPPLLPGQVQPWMTRTNGQRDDDGTATGTRAIPTSPTGGSAIRSPGSCSRTTATTPG